MKVSAWSESTSQRCSQVVVIASTSDQPCLRAFPTTSMKSLKSFLSRESCWTDVDHVQRLESLVGKNKHQSRSLNPQACHIRSRVFVHHRLSSLLSTTTTPLNSRPHPHLTTAMAPASKVSEKPASTAGKVSQDALERVIGTWTDALSTGTCQVHRG